MKRESYLKYIEYTIGTYNKVTKNRLLDLYKKENIVRKKDNQVFLFSDDAIEIDNSNIDATLIKCIKANEKAIEIYEKFQFIRAYRYAVLFTCINFDELQEKVNNIPEYKYTPTDIRLDDNLQTPKKIVKDNDIILMFEKKYEAVHPQTEEELFLHYPIIVVLHKDKHIVELRFDSIKRLFVEEKNNQTIYINIISQVLSYFNINYSVELTPLELNFMKTLADDEENKNIKLISQYMNMKNGGKAELNVGNNEEYVLPLIGELKSIMNDLKEDLDNNLRIKDALEQFIYEKEETTDYPWIEVLFLDEEGIKTRNNHVKFTFNYMNQNYCLITYYYNSTLIEMERMNNVTRFIGENIQK